MRLIETNPNPILNKGIFQALKQKTNDFAWLTNESAKTLDLDYYFNVSGNKKISPIYNRLINLYNNDSDTILSKLSDVILLKYTESWNRLYLAIVESDYNPIENYNSEEITTPNITRKSLDKTKSKTTRTTDDDGSSYGFNSEFETPTSASHQVETIEGDDTDNIKDGTYTETGTSTMIRHGNIGVMTNQNMINEEIELRLKSYYDIIYKCVDDVLTTSY